MLIYPHIDPVAIHLGPIAVHWYGLMYLLAFMLFIALGRLRLRKPFVAAQGWKPEDLDDILFYGVLGVILGGRLGQVLFYEPGYFFSHPLEIFAVWKGGMSFHGGFIGVIVAIWLWGRKHGRSLLSMGDFVAPLCATGLFTGRIGNFINGELWGRVAPADLPWAMIFPHVDNLPRHPSQLYQAGMEGLLLFILIWIYARKERPLGALSAAFLFGYGCFRFIGEYFRTPDMGIFGQSDVISMGQWLSLPMIIAGLALMAWSYRNASKSNTKLR